MMPELNLEREKDKRKTSITPGLDIATLKNEDDVVGKYKTETTVF